MCVFTFGDVLKIRLLLMQSSVATRKVEVSSFSTDVWNPLGTKILGTPVGRGVERLAEEQKLWDVVPFIPELQCSWQVRLQGAGPRC